MNKRLSWKLLMVALSITCAMAVMIYYVASYFVVSHAEESIRNLLLSHKGMHHYVQKIMHPALYQYKDAGEIPEKFYAPELFSSSFIIRNMHDFFNDERVENNLPKVYYKMAASNPRNPVNKADAKEDKLIRMFNKNRNLKEHREIVKIDGKRYLYYAQPFLENNEACLKCHGDRKDAPIQLQERYEGMGGFGEKVGDIRAIISIRTPFEHDFSIIYIILTGALSGFIVLISLVFFNQRLKENVALKTASLTKEVNERTKAEDELKKQADKLKKQADELEKQADEAETHADEMEKINKLFVGRELKMRDLKKEIEELNKRDKT